MAILLPIHCQLSLSSHIPKYEARLNAKSGRNTLKPTEAASPIPKKILMIVSEVIIRILFSIHAQELFQKKVILKSNQVQFFFRSCNGCI